MHELSIAENIVEIICEELVKNNTSQKVEKVILKAGRMSNIVPDSLRFYYDLLKEEKPLLVESVLEVVEIPIQGVCVKCNTTYELENILSLCNICGEALQIQSGNEMTIDSIIVAS